MNPNILKSFSVMFICYLRNFTRNVKICRKLKLFQQIKHLSVSIREIFKGHKASELLLLVRN